MPVRRLAAVFAAVVLAASLSGVALAESGPTVSGLVLQRYHWNLSQSNSSFDLVQQRLRLNVSGTTAQNVQYYLRAQVTEGPQARPPAAEIFLANASLALPYGATLTVGRQTLNWTVLDEFKGFLDVSAAVHPGDDAITLTAPVGPAKVTVGYSFDLKNKEYAPPADEPAATVAFVQLPLQTGGPSVKLGAQLVAPSIDGADLRWGVNGSVGLGAVTPYLEVGSGRADDRLSTLAKNDYRVIGVKFDILRDLYGVEALVEYDSARSQDNLFARVGKQVLPGLWLHLRRETNGDFNVRTELSVSF